MLHLLIFLSLFNGAFCSNEQNNNNQNIVNFITINNKKSKTHEFLNLAGDTPVSHNNPINVNFGTNPPITSQLSKPQNKAIQQNNNIPSTNNQKKQCSLEWYNEVNQNISQNKTAIKLLHKDNQKTEEKNNNLNNTVNKITHSLNKLIYYKQQEDHLKNSGECIDTRFNKFVDTMLNQEQKYLTQAETVSNIHEENQHLKNEVTGLQKTIENQNQTIVEQSSVINNLTQNMKILIERVKKLENESKITGKKRKSNDNNDEKKKKKFRKFV